MVYVIWYMLYGSHTFCLWIITISKALNRNCLENQNLTHVFLVRTVLWFYSCWIAIIVLSQLLKATQGRFMYLGRPDRMWGRSTEWLHCKPRARGSWSKVFVGRGQRLPVENSKPCSRRQFLWPSLYFLLPHLLFLWSQPPFDQPI